MALACGIVHCGGNAADIVQLRDGRELRGRVVELGGNAVEVRFGGGSSRRVPLKEIRRATFDAAAEPLSADADLVIRKNGSEVKGDATYSEDGRHVVVSRPDGSRIEIPRQEVARVIRRGEDTAEGAAVYSKEVREGVRDALGRLAAPGAAAVEAEEKLRSWGIFAIASVEEARATAKANSPERRALDRVARLYRLREITPDPLQDLADYYRILSTGTVEEKRGLLEEMFLRYPEPSAPVAKFLVRDPEEDPSVRAWAVDLLGRMRMNRELVEVFNDPAGGQIQLAAAIALARNRILAGAEALIQALEMDTPAAREVAIATLKDAVGKDLGFGVHDTPSARKEAVARWKSWWAQNRDSIQAQAKSLLGGGRPVDESPERRRAQELWKQGSLAWEEKRYAEAESALRAALRADPTFVQAQASLGVLLALHRKQGDEGRRLLEDLLTRRLPGADERAAGTQGSDLTAWVRHYLAQAWELEGDLDRAEAEYRRALGADPRSFRAGAALAELTLRRATDGGQEPPEARRRLLREALDRYRATIEQIDAFNAGLETLSLTDLPVESGPLFERQEYNRGVLAVKASLRKRKAEMHFGIAKVRALLGDPQRAVEELTSAIETVGDDRGGGARELLVELYSYRASLLEEAGEVAQALGDYRTVVKEDLDPRNAAALDGIRRLKARAGAAPRGGAPTQKRRKG